VARVPNYTADTGQPMRHRECLEKMWEPVLGLDLLRFYSEPDYYLEYFLRYKVLKFRRLATTRADPRHSMWLRRHNEAAMLGQGVACSPA